MGEGDSQPAGYVYYVTDGSGQGGSGTKATEEVYGYVDLTRFFVLAGSVAKPIKYPGTRPKTEDAVGLGQKIEEVAGLMKSSSDEQIKKQSTGTGPETDGSGRAMKNNSANRNELLSVPYDTLEKVDGWMMLKGDGAVGYIVVGDDTTRVEYIEQ